MSLLVVIAGLLLAGALGLLYFPWSGKGAVDRDALNRALYQSRLQAPELFAAIFVAALFGVVVFWAFGLLGRQVVGRWYDFDAR